MEVIYGKHSVRAVFIARPSAVRRIVMREGAAKYLGEFVDLAKRAGLKPQYLRSGEFLREGRLNEDDKHQGLFVVADPLKVYGEHDFGILHENSRIVILDQVSNPQNFGTIIRTAAYFGIEAIFWLKNRAVDITPAVSRVAVGGTEFVKLFRITNLARTLEALKQQGFRVYGLDERGETVLAETRFDPRSALVIGAEGQGLRRLTKELCDQLIRIPGGRRGLESLNAAVAAALAIAAACI